MCVWGVWMGKSKVRTGSATEGLEMLSAEVCSEIQKKWEAVVTPANSSLESHESLEVTESSVHGQSCLTVHGTRFRNTHATLFLPHLTSGARQYMY